ncbi:glycosyltransferase family 2 protein [Bacillus sp. 1P10SD]|uniref:glycosyltransferase family 2 protein n=1 Tax=Bacillus sp. 1P10SD TaxID=3132265 RepID=UPI0039A70E95
MSNRIAAIVVTFNRKECLQNCLISLLEQTKKVDRIFIIDNASTDGTENFVKSTFSQFEDIEYIRLNKNIGGAGGFNYGLKTAFDNGYDYMWVMDDDGIPQSNCLEELLNINHKTGGEYICSSVINQDDHDTFVFGLFDKQNNKMIRNLNDVSIYKSKGYIEGCANPFNGLLLTRNLIVRAGLPKKELFIWGDEIEYELRVINKGFKIYTAINAIHLHPVNKIKTYKLLFGKLNVSYFGENNLRSYCYFRNRAFIYKKYFALTKLPLFYIKYFMFFITKRNFKGIKFFLKASHDGLNENFRKHFHYIN